MYLRGCSQQPELRRCLPPVSYTHLVAISVAGPIGFLALVAPQIARRLWNTPGMAMWHSALLGSVILVLADFVSARALAPFQIPVGLVTGALGGVYMLWLLYRQR